MLKFNKKLNKEIDTYLTETEVLHLLEYYCKVWKFQEWKYEKIEKPVYQFIKSKAKKLIENDFIKIKVWSNYWFEESELRIMFSKYLIITKQHKSYIY